MHINRKFRTVEERKKDRVTAIIVLVSIGVTVAFLLAYQSYTGYTLIRTAVCKGLYGPGYEIRYSLPVKQTKCSCREGFIFEINDKNPIGFDCKRPDQICKDRNKSFKKGEAVYDPERKEITIDCS